MMPTLLGRAICVTQSTTANANPERLSQTHPETTFSKVSGHSVIQSGWYIKVTITRSYPLWGEHVPVLSSMYPSNQSASRPHSHCLSQWFIFFPSGKCPLGPSLTVHPAWHRIVFRKWMYILPTHLSRLDSFSQLLLVAVSAYQGPHHSLLHIIYFVSLAEWMMLENTRESSARCKFKRKEE